MKKILLTIMIMLSFSMQCFAEDAVIPKGTIFYTVLKNKLTTKYKPIGAYKDVLLELKEDYRQRGEIILTKGSSFDAKVEVISHSPDAHLFKVQSHNLIHSCKASIMKIGNKRINNNTYKAKRGHYAILKPGESIKIRLDEDFDTSNVSGRDKE